jgi:hypothetical protein
MNKSESIKNFAAAMATFQGEVKNPPKSADNPFYKSKYTTLDVLIDTAKPLLKSNGLSFIQSCSGDGVNIIVTTLLMHNSGEWVESDPLTLRADKATAQGAGSAITYARRYALAAALGLASDEDDDGNQAETTANKPKQEQKKPKEDKPTDKPTTQMITELGARAMAKGISLKTKGVELTGKPSSQYWDMVMFNKVSDFVDAQEVQL